MKYVWASAYGVINTKEVEADTVGQRLDSLREEIGEALNPDDVVSDAKPEGSPLHDLFEWDDTEAAGHWRKHQARFVLHSLRIVVPDDSMEARSIIANVHIGDVGYVNIQTMVRNPDYIELAETEAMRYLEGFKARYEFMRNDSARLKEIFDVLEAVE